MPAFFQPINQLFISPNSQTKTQSLLISSKFDLKYYYPKTKRIFLPNVFSCKINFYFMLKKNMSDKCPNWVFMSPQQTDPAPIH